MRIADPSTEIAHKVIKLCNDELGIHIEINNISTAHCLNLKRLVNLDPSLFDFCVALLEIWSTKRNRNLKHLMMEKLFHSVFINEDLTESSRKLFRAARFAKKNKQLNSVWTTNCKIHVRDVDDTYHALSSLSKLKDLEDHASS